MGISIMVQQFKFPVAMGRLHHGARCNFGSLASKPDCGSNGLKAPSTRCYYEYEAFTSLRILESEVFRVNFLKLFTMAEN
jgi:hypothetical protein